MKQQPTAFALLRETTGLSVAETADRLGVSQKTVYRWENGEVEPKALVLKELRGIAHAATGTRRLRQPTFRFIDLFAGIGGLRLAFEAINGQCVFTSEWDKYCRTTYQKNFSVDHPIAGDIREVDVEDVPAYDVLVAGFPCQPFSIAGVSKKNALKRPHGFHCDTQGTLFFEVARFLEAHRPAAFLLENVRNLVSHDRGRTFEIIKKTLQEELGYSVAFKVIDAKAWVPQHRERIFIVGFRHDVGFSFDDVAFPDSKNGPKLRAILHSENGDEPAEDPYTLEPAAKVSEKYILTAHLWRYLQDYAAKHKAKGNGFGFGRVGPDDVARTLSARYFKDGSEILVSRGNGRPRRLTPRECARLMGFDEPGKKPFDIPVSDTQAYKQFGNAVVVPVARFVAKQMAPFILRAMHLPDSKIEPELPLSSNNVRERAIA